MSTNANVEILAPPTRICFECGSSLSFYHTCEAELYTLSGVKPATKVTLLCQLCKLLYNYSQFGNKLQLGYRYYQEMQLMVEVTDATFVERKLLEFQCNLVLVYIIIVLLCIYLLEITLGYHSRDLRKLIMIHCLSKRKKVRCV